MATEFEITFRNVSEYDQLHPGDTLQGTVVIIPDKELDCKHLFIRLLWHTEGRGTRYSQNVDELDVYQGKLQQGFPTSFEFSFVLPYEPWSYEGHYVSVVWKVQAQIDLSLSRDPQGEKAFILRPLPSNEASEKSAW